VQKQVIEGRQMMIVSRSSRGSQREFSMTVSGSKSSCGVKVILSSRSMVDRRHVNNRSVKRRINRSRVVLRGRC
jgi:hypothetical protein